MFGVLDGLGSSGGSDFRILDRDYGSRRVGEGGGMGGGWKQERSRCADLPSLSQPARHQRLKMMIEGGIMGNRYLENQCLVLPGPS